MSDTLIDNGGVSGGGTLTIPAGSSASLAPGWEVSGSDDDPSGGTTLVNDGTMTVESNPLSAGCGGQQQLVYGGVLKNNATLNLDDDLCIIGYDNNTTSELVNEAGGTVNYSGGPDGAEIEASFVDSGTVDVNGGTLTSDNLTLTGSPVFDGSGSLNLENVTADTATVTLSSLTSSVLGNMDVSDAVTLVGSWTLSGGVSGGGTLTIPAGSSASLAPGWEVSGSDDDPSGGTTLVNDGTMTVESNPLSAGCGGQQQLVYGGVLKNNATLNLDDDLCIIGYDNNTTSELVNEAGGTVNYSGGPDGAEIEASFVDSGTVDVNGGTLTSDNLTLTGSPVFDGSGSLNLENVTADTATVTLSSLTSSVLGNMDVSDAVTLVGSWTLSGGVSGGGTLTIPAGSSASLAPGWEVSGSDDDPSGGTTLVNDGTMTVESNPLSAGCGGQQQLVYGGVLKNNATLNLDDDLCIIGYDNNTTSELVNEAGGTVNYSGGPDGAEIEASFVDSGTVDVNGGTLTVSTYTPTSTSALTVGVGFTRGRLAVSGAAKIRGTLVITTKAGYLPKVGAKVTILTAGSKKGTFSTVTGTQLSGEHWRVSYKATSVVLTMVSG